MSTAESFDKSRSDAAGAAPGITTPGSIWKSGPLAGVFFLLLGGLAAWLLVQRLHPMFNYDEFRNGFGALPAPLEWQLNRNNSMSIFALIGGLTGAAFAISEGICRKSASTALIAGLACVAVGAGLGSLAGYLGFRTYEAYKSSNELSELAKSIRVHAMTLGTLGGGVGLAAGLFLGQRFTTALKCLIGGLLSGVLAAILYPIAVAYFFPYVVTKSFLPIAPKEQILWLGLITGLLGIIIPSVAADPPPKRVA